MICNLFLTLGQYRPTIVSLIFLEFVLQYLHSNGVCFGATVVDI